MVVGKPSCTKKIQKNGTIFPYNIHHKLQQRYSLVPFLRLRLQSNCNLKNFQSVLLIDFIVKIVRMKFVPHIMSQ